MFYPINPTEKYSLFAIRLRKYKAHFYTKGAAGFLPKACVCQPKSSLLTSISVCQAPPTAPLRRTTSAPSSHPSRPTTPRSSSTWTQTLPSTTRSRWRAGPTCTPCWRRSRRSSSSLKPAWCLERARSPEEMIPTCGPAATRTAAPSPSAAAVPRHSSSTHKVNWVGFCFNSSSAFCAVI